jgi:proteasome lid subunit RPN8/RPN11
VKTTVVVNGTLRVSARALDEMIAAARAAEPSECCGVLLGTPGEITEAVPARNLAGDPNRFLIDPKDHIEARREGRRRGLEVVGFYHSHPHSPAAPSSTDLEEASYSGSLYAIVGLVAEPAEVRIYRFDDGSFIGVPFLTMS